MSEKAKKSWMKLCLAWPVGKGTLAEVRKRCNRPGCKRCESGEKHAVWQFTCKVQGKARAFHVPNAAVEEMRQALENGRRLEHAMVETAIAILDGYRKKRQE